MMSKSTAELKTAFDEANEYAERLALRHRHALIRLGSIGRKRPDDPATTITEDLTTALAQEDRTREKELRVETEEHNTFLSAHGPASKQARIRLWNARADWAQARAADLVSEVEPLAVKVHDIRRQLAALETQIMPLRSEYHLMGKYLETADRPKLVAFPI